MTDQAWLQKLYIQFDTPVDSLATKPEILAAFVDSAKHIGYSLTPEHLLKLLFTARKKGQLPRLRR